MEENLCDDWYKDWFDTSYYHLLYKDRDFAEAERFLDHLLQELKPNSNSKLLDVACGKGRHSIYLNHLGYEVTGFDLSNESISYARKFEGKSLHFFQHDMRLPLRINYFDWAFNLFTSLGYFPRPLDNLKVIQSMAAAIKPGGGIVIDFLNAEFVIKNLVKYSEKRVEGLTFSLKKEIINNEVIKTISFIDNGKLFEFQERVTLLTLEDFKSMFRQSGLNLEGVFGDYNLSDFDSASSDRLILIGRKGI